MNLIECFQPNLIGNKDASAIQFADQKLTFGDLNARSDAVASVLKSEFGIQKGDRLAMYLGNGIELILFYLAGLKLGAIIVPMNVLYRDRELTHQFMRARLSSEESIKKYRGEKTNENDTLLAQRSPYRYARSVCFRRRS